MSRYKLTIEVDDLDELTRVTHALDATLGADPGGVLGQVATSPPAPAPKPKAGKARGKKAPKKAAAKAKPATSDLDALLGAPDDAEAEVRTQEEVMGMFERCAEEHGENAAPGILAILQQHGCKKLSDLGEENFGSVYDQLEAMLAP